MRWEVAAAPAVAPVESFLDAGRLARANHAPAVTADGAAPAAGCPASAFQTRKLEGRPTAVRRDALSTPGFQPTRKGARKGQTATLGGLSSERCSRASCRARTWALLSRAS